MKAELLDMLKSYRCKIRNMQTGMTPSVRRELLEQIDKIIAKAEGK